MSSKARIGFIGVGLMGHGMAKNLITKGHPLVIMGHRNRQPVDHLVSLGATEAKTPKAVAEAVDVLHLCVTGSPQVEALMRGPQGVFAAKRPGLVIVDCSTSNPVSTLQLAKEAQAVGMQFVDAPLSRTPKEAEEGTLDTMVGAPRALFEQLEPIFRCWAGNVVHLGDVGLGHKMKLINNFVAMGYAALFAEAIALSRKAGLSIDQFHSVIGAGRMRSPFYDTFMKYVHGGDPNAHQFTIQNAHKDMRYLASMATEIGAVNPLQSAVRNSFAAMEAAGEGDKYVPMLADYIAKVNGLS